MSRVVFGIILYTNAIGYLILNHRWFISDCYLIYSRCGLLLFYSVLRYFCIIALFKSNIEWKHLRTHSGNCDLEYLFNYFIISLWTYLVCPIKIITWTLNTYVYQIFFMSVYLKEIIVIFTKHKFFLFFSRFMHLSRSSAFIFYTHRRVLIELQRKVLTKYFRWINR